ncbi:hypothetical protein IFM89_012111 [Coptis chinensis]|uniref:NB-ARC domain-containing protein n=1 Tax=Coptis chinensis TaxID=261450 RepID=A0A835I2S0_9MAGN|nr:hypothetical protein IFM89_012111 [Coptis chinensis]
MSIYGMGGSGKTTLVSSIYNNQNVQSNFDCYAWITVSQAYKIQELFRSLLKELFESQKELVAHDLRTMEYRQLVEILVDYLERRRYFIVLDDVWSISLWWEIRVALPEGVKSSRIILTTRNEEIASFSYGVGSFIHHIQPLQKDEAWSFFCRIAFSYVKNKCCPNEVSKIARLIVSKCQGLPLAIVAMGVSCRKRDSFIKPKRLFRLWIAEGFVAERRGMTLEEVAETYFMELVSQNMVQVEERRDCGRPTLCRMHDLLRELALSTSESENFCLVYEESVATEICRVRRLSIHVINGIEATDEIVKQLGKLTQLQKIGFVKITEEHGTELCKSIQKLKLLNTLSLMVFDAGETLKMDAMWSPPPLLQKINFIGKLEKVPLWLGALHLLTSLCLRWSQLTEDPPTCIHALPRVSKLFLINAYNGRKLYFRKEWFPKLKFLTLSTLQELNQVTIEEGALPRLQSLDLVRCQELKMVPEGIKHLINLQKLYLADAQKELVEQFRGGADRPKFQHIPEIGNHNKTNDGWNYERLSSVSVNNDKYSRAGAKYRHII